MNFEPGYTNLDLGLYIIFDFSSVGQNHFYHTTEHGYITVSVYVCNFILVRINYMYLTFWWNAVKNFLDCNIYLLILYHECYHPKLTTPKIFEDVLNVQIFHSF